MGVRRAFTSPPAPQSSQPAPVHPLLPPFQRRTCGGLGSGAHGQGGADTWASARARRSLLRDLEEITSPLWPQASSPEGGT